MDSEKKDQREQLNAILGKYDQSVQRVYQSILKQEKGVKNLRKDQIKTLIDGEIMAQVNKNAD